MKVVLDTNVVVSGICFPDSPCGRILTLRNQVDFVWSDALITEMYEVLGRPKFDKRAPLEARLRLATALVASGEELAIEDTTSRCRDPKDDHVLQLAVTASASFIVTGDDDILTLGPLGSIRVTTPSEFLLVLESTGQESGLT